MITLIAATAVMFSPQQTLEVVQDTPRLEALEKKVEALSRSRSDCVLHISAGALDIYSTEYALSRNEDAFEANPLGFNAGARIALKAATIPLACYVSRQLRLQDKNGWANAFVWTSVAAHVAISLSNFSKSR